MTEPPLSRDSRLVYLPWVSCHHYSLTHVTQPRANTAPRSDVTQRAWRVSSAINGHQPVTPRHNDTPTKHNTALKEGVGGGRGRRNKTQRTCRSGRGTVGSRGGGRSRQRYWRGGSCRQRGVIDIVEGEDWNRGAWPVGEGAWHRAKTSKGVLANLT
ncbi:hypothetical protein E2C01_007493 [Portunus trituberculatus]|uniref:Uncharacterized protein n=1 Tax=Portunus trituberculatus TaxID=210409 RepID=A0A5B7CYC1_PORTR|nr:hypothetical protein [Portunus trituberculatus]